MEQTLSVAGVLAVDPADAGGSGGAALSAEQEKALESLMAGESAAAAAKEAGVSRMTIYRWRSTDPAFQAALAAWEAETVALNRYRLATVAGMAVSVIAQAVEKGDKAAALAVLKAQGLMTPARVPQQR